MANPTRIPRWLFWILFVPLLTGGAAFLFEGNVVPLATVLVAMVAVQSIVKKTAVVVVALSTLSLVPAFSGEGPAESIRPYLVGPSGEIAGATETPAGGAFALRFPDPDGSETAITFLWSAGAPGRTFVRVDDWALGELEGVPADWTPADWREVFDAAIPLTANPRVITTRLEAWVRNEALKIGQAPDSDAPPPFPASADCFSEWWECQKARMGAAIAGAATAVACTGAAVQSGANPVADAACGVAGAGLIFQATTAVIPACVAFGRCVACAIGDAMCPGGSGGGVPECPLYTIPMPCSSGGQPTGICCCQYHFDETGGYLDCYRL